MTLWNDIGHGVKIAANVWEDHGQIGIYEQHTTPEGQECIGAVHFDVPVVRETWPDVPMWTVEQWEPLTLAPSLLCRRCGNHGFIREGRWVPA